MTVKITTRATRYDVSALPAEHPDYEAFVIRVEERGGGRWAVTRYGNCLDANGRWSYERIPSERTDEWKTLNRHAMYNAMQLAAAALPDLSVNGHTLATVLGAEPRCWCGCPEHAHTPVDCRTCPGDEDRAWRHPFATERPPT